MSLRSISKRVWAVAALVLAAAVGAFVALVVNDEGQTVKETIFRTPLLRTSVGYDHAVYSDGFRSVAPNRDALRDALQGVDGCSSLLEAAQSAGAFNIDTTFLRLSVEAARHKDVSITNMRPRILDRDEPQQGIRVFCAGGGEQVAVGLYFNLDDPEPQAQRLNPDGSPGVLYFARREVFLEQNEVRPFRIKARSTRDAVEWVLDITLVVDGRDHMKTVTDAGGRPFRTTGMRSSYDDHVQWDWDADPPRLVPPAEDL